MWRMFRDARILGILGLLLCATAVSVLNATVYSPEAAVMRYLTALEEGREADLVAIVWGDSVSLTYDIRVPADPAHRPSEPRISNVAADSDSALVTAVVTLDGKQVSEVFALRADGGWSPLSQWRFEVLPVSTVHVVSVPAAPVSINGASSGGSAVTWVPVVAEVSSGSTWFDAPPVTVTATTPAGNVLVDPIFEPTDALTDVLNATVREHLDACAAEHTLVPTNCPFAGFTAMAVSAGPDWSIEKYPDVAVAAEEGRWRMSGSGKVRLSVTLIDFATEKKEKYSQLMNFTVSGTVVGLNTGSPRLVLDNTVER